MFVPVLDGCWPPSPPSCGATCSSACSGALEPDPSVLTAPFADGAAALRVELFCAAVWLCEKFVSSCSSLARCAPAGEGGRLPSVVGYCLLRDIGVVGGLPCSPSSLAEVGSSSLCPFSLPSLLAEDGSDSGVIGCESERLACARSVPSFGAKSFLATAAPTPGASAVDAATEPSPVRLSVPDASIVVDERMNQELKLPYAAPLSQHTRPGQPRPATSQALPC
jgi:hypothetical protein